MSSSHRSSRRRSRSRERRREGFDVRASESGPVSKSQHLPPPQRFGGASVAPQPPAQASAAPPAAAPPPPAEALATLWVGSLLPTVNDDDIFDAFAPYGFVTDVNLMTESGPGGLQAYVKYTDRSEAEEALSASLNRQLLVKGKTVTCRWAKQDIVNIAQLKSAAVNAAQAAAAAAAAVAAAAAPPQRSVQNNVAGYNYIAPKIWIGNLPMGTTEDDVRKVCRGVGGELVDIIVHKKPSQYGQLSGFMRFRTQMETDIVLRAVSTGTVLIKGAVLKADWAKGTQPGGH